MEPNLVRNVNSENSAPAEPKFFLRSKTILSALLIALPAILRSFDVHFSDADVQLWGERASTLLGLLGVIYGRVRSTGPLHIGTGVAPVLLALFLAIALLTGCETLKVNLKYCREVGGQTVCVGTDGKTVTLSNTAK